MSIDSIVFADEYDMPLRHPTTDEPLYMSDGSPMYIRVMRASAPPLKALQAKYRNETLRNPSKKVSAEKIDARVIEQLVTATTWWALEGAEGPIPFSASAARKLYSDKQKEWIAKQVEKTMYDEDLYLGESLPS